MRFLSIRLFTCWSAIFFIMLKKIKQKDVMNEQFFTRSIAILAGGKSSRFGSNKAFAPFLGARIIDFVLDACKKSGTDIFIIANQKKYQNLGLPVYPDIHEGLGPLAGIHSALKHARSDRVFVTACDMPLLNNRLIKWMFSLNRKEPVIVPEFDNRLQPLHAIYSKRLLPFIEQCLEKKRLSLHGLLNKLPCYVVHQNLILPFCPNGLCFANANTKKELERLEEVAPQYFEKVLS